MDGIDKCHTISKHQGLGSADTQAFTPENQTENQDH